MFQKRVIEMDRIVLIEIDITEEGYSRDNPILIYITTDKTQKEITHLLSVLEKLYKEDKISFDTLHSSVQLDIGKEVGFETYEVDV